MPYFIVHPFHGKEHYRIENDDFPIVYKEGVAVIMHNNGQERWPRALHIFKIPQYVANLGLDILTLIYKGYTRAELKPIAVSAAQSEIDLLYNIAQLKLQPKPKET